MSKTPIIDNSDNALAKKTKALLCFVFSKNFNEFEELGIGYIASELRRNGYEVMLLSNDPGNINYDDIVNFKPDIIGFTIYQVYKSAVYEVCQALRKLLPDAKICVGGVEATFNGSEILEEAEFIDFAIVGEGEESFLDLVKCLETEKDITSVKGLIYRNNGGIAHNSGRGYINDLNALANPARDILVQNKLKIALVASSRGCTGVCSFCSSRLMNKKWRGRNVKATIDEIEYVQKEYDIDSFSFIDSSFEDPGSNCKRIQEIAEEIIQRKLNITYFVDMRAEFFKKVDEELIKLLKESGLICVMIGFESNNEFDLKLYRKRANIEDNSKAIETLRKYDILVKCGFITFNPYSTFEGLRKNVMFLNKYGYANNLECIANKLSTYSGTQLYNKIKNDNLLSETKSMNKFKGYMDYFCDYKFVDERVGRLADYVYSYMRQESGISNFLARIRLYPLHFFLITNNLKHKIKYLQNERLFHFMEAFDSGDKKVIEEVCFHLNNRIAEWFLALIDLAENEWDIIKANEISENLLNKEYLKDTANKLDAIKNKFILNMLRKDPALNKYIFRF